MLSLRNTILEMTAKGVDLKATIDRLCVEIEARAPGIVCSVLTVDRDGLLHPLSAPSLPQNYCDALDGVMIGPDVGSCGSAAWTRAPVAVTDIATDPRWAEFREGALALGLNACWSTPIFGEDGRVLGTFALYYREMREPTDKEREIVASCIHLCSIALERHDRVIERERRANVDLLTTLANRAAFAQTLARLNCDRPGHWALLIVDLDNLKIVNDGFGHHAGDLLIQTAAKRIAAASSPDRVFRIGGDEFAVLVHSSDGLSDLDAFAARILEALGEPLDCNGHAVVPKATIGGAVLASGDRTAETVRKNADFALYHAKETGRGGFVRYWPGIDTRIIHRISAIRDVGAALREARIEAHYQPVVCLDTRRIVAMEALCRLRMSNGGILAASAFREATADVHVASDLTERMLAIVANDVLAWADEAIGVDHIGINVSLSDFLGGKLEEQIETAHARHGLPLERVVIEITESVHSACCDESVTRVIQALRARGVRVALDDFGTGGGLLMPLLTMPVDMIKIDKVLVDQLAPGGAGSAVIEGLLRTARALDITVIAEGIESEAQASQLVRLGCALGQGYFFSKPLDKAAMIDLLSDRQPGFVSKVEGHRTNIDRP